MTSHILVSGATGTQGGAVARSLLGHGHRVRAMTRNPQSAAAQALSALGAETVAADFDDPASLVRAATGVDAVYAMGTPYEADAEAEERQAIALLDAAVQAGTSFIVYSSVASALDHTGVPHFDSKARVEQHLATLAVPHTVVAPAMFTDNLRTPDNIAQIRAGRHAFPAPADLRIQQIVIADLAEFTALVFDDPERFAGRRIEIASQDASGSEIAEILTRVTEHPVEYTEVPLEALDRSGNDDLAAMMRFFRERGYSVDIDRLHREFPAVGWHSIERWATQHTW